nr:hypothetical protein [uncultured Dyadobacter sp.]
MQSSVTDSKQTLSGDRFSSLTPSLISTSLGGAVLGGSVGHITGALLGGAFGIIIALFSEYRNTPVPTKKN